MSIIFHKKYIKINKIIIKSYKFLLLLLLNISGISRLYGNYRFIKLNKENINNVLCFT